MEHVTRFIRTISIMGEEFLLDESFYRRGDYVYQL